MKKLGRNLVDMPFDIVGSTKFGRYPKISNEQTFNMIISDDFLVPFAGYSKVNSQSLGNFGRAIYSSFKNNTIYFVVDNVLYSFQAPNFINNLATLNSTTGDISIAENNGNQIAICDGIYLYIYNYSTGAFNILTPTTLGFQPTHISFQDTYFIATCAKGTGGTTSWQLSFPNDGTNWPFNSQTGGAFQTKPDTPIATIRLPGHGNLLLVFGSTVTEFWNDIGLQLFPYQRNASFNLDYGCANSTTIAALENYVVWLSISNQAAPSIMFCDGSNIEKISNDGIDFILANLTSPSSSYGYFFRQDGHLIYVITFYIDNFSFAYDFNTKAFFTLTDENLDYFVAKKVVFYNDTSYFVSINDGNLYEMSTNFVDYNGAEIPRIRRTKPTRMPDNSRFVVQQLTFTLEQGETPNTQVVDYRFSKDGQASWSNYLRKSLNPLGQRANKFDIWNLGASNEISHEIRFYGDFRFIAGGGLTRVYQ